MFLHSSSPSGNSVTYLHSIILVSKKPFHSPVGSCEKETWVVHVLVWLTLLLHPKLLEAWLPCLWLLNGDVTGCGIVGWSRDLPLRSLRARAPARQPASRQRPRHGRPASKPASKFCSGKNRRKITTPRRLEGRGSSEVPRLPDVGDGMLLAGYARDCQLGPVVLSQRCINPHPGILPNAAAAHTQPHHPPLLPIMVSDRVERTSEFMINESKINPETTNMIFQMFGIFSSLS